MWRSIEQLSHAVDQITVRAAGHVDRGAGCRPRSHGKTDINPTSAELTPWWAARAQIATTTAIATKATDTRIRTS